MTKRTRAPGDTSINKMSQINALPHTKVVRKHATSYIKMRLSLRTEDALNDEEEEDAGAGARAALCCPVSLPGLRV